MIPPRQKQLVQQKLFSTSIDGNKYQYPNTKIPRLCLDPISNVFNNSR